MILANGGEPLFNASVSFTMGLLGFASLFSIKMIMGIAVTWMVKTVERQMMRRDDDYKDYIKI